MTTDARELASALAAVYQKAVNDPWRGAPNELTQTAPSEAFKDSWDTINNSLRSTTQAVVLEQALEPLRKAVTHFTPEFEELKEARAAALLDFDSNKRRLTDLEQQKAMAEAKHKHIGDAAISLDSKIEKYQQKRSTSGAEFDKLNEQAKTYATEGKAKHDELMDSIIVTAAVCQAELFRMAAAELDKVCDAMPQEHVADLRARVRDLLKQGGTIVPEQDKKAPRRSSSAIMGALGGFFNKETPLTPPPAANMAQHHHHTAVEGSVPPSPSSGPPPTAPAAQSQSSSACETSAPASPAAVPVPAPSPAPALSAEEKAYPIVTALYDNEADADDELAFNAGDKVEVLKIEDGGWWFGRCKGQEGLFPVDYVNVEEMQQ